MVDNIPENFKNKFEHDKEGMKCSYCSSGAVPSLVCPAWQGIRDGLDLELMEDLTMFFRRMLAERAKIGGKKA